MLVNTYHYYIKYKVVNYPDSVNVGNGELMASEEEEEEESSKLFFAISFFEIELNCPAWYICLFLKAFQEIFLNAF